MAGQAIHGCFDLAGIGRIHQVRHRMSSYRMPQSVLERKHNGLVLLEVVGWQFDLAVEDGDQVLRLKLLRLRVGAMASRQSELTSLVRSR